VANYSATLMGLLLPFGLGVNGYSVPPLQAVPDDNHLPWITIQMVAGSELESLGGLSGLTLTTMQINVWSVAYDEAIRIRDLVVDALKDFSGPVASSPLSIDRITNIRYRELYDETVNLYQGILRVDIWWY
jgi:hypothetical protein